MKRALAIAAILTTILSAFGQRVDILSYIGDMLESMVNRWASIPFMRLHTWTLIGVLEADLTIVKAIGAPDSTHLALPQAVFENRVGVTPPLMASWVSWSSQTRHTRKHSRRHYRNLR
jgi:hypothetical protein